ncbi:UNVERIFIED_CONTAM: phage tail protein, partial [Melissococcus plutonius]
QPPQCTFEMMAEDASSGKTAHVAVLNGTFSASAIDLKTNTANPVHSPDKLTFKAEERRSDGETYVDAVEDKDFDKDKWEQLVRPKVTTKPESQYDDENTKYDNGNTLA